MPLGLIIDTEVASLKTNEVVELAYKVPCGEVVQQKFKPSGPWDLGAVATHHILPADVADEQPSETALGQLPHCEYIVAHNVDFDAEVLGGLTGVKRICTLAIARKAWPKLDSHSLTALAYHILGLSDSTRERLRDAHAAAVDVDLCELVLFEALDVAGIAAGAALRRLCHESPESPAVSPLWHEIWEFSEEARVPEIMPFGKHKGERIRDVPADYKRWLARQDDVDPYLMKALKL